MVPVPAPKKFWVFDGSVAQYPSVLTSNSVHMGKSCTDCHGGDDTKNSRTAAHATAAGFKANPGAQACSSCHSATATSSAQGLHATLAGFPAILDKRGATSAEARERFDKQCTGCHALTADDQPACGFCHVSVPATAGGGFLRGHAFQKTPSMDNNCTACHGSRVKDEYYGQSNALLSRNKAAFDESSPFKAAAFTLQSDVHKSKGLSCEDCHSGDEMHGVGAPTDDDRYAVSTAPACTDCHGTGQSDATAFAAVTLHRSEHLAKMDCQVCHAQPYKSCFSCHTDVTESGQGFFKTNGGDPTLAARKAAATDPSTVTPDALITFRAGVNPKWTGAGDDVYKQYTVLRHVPIDADVFAYSGVNLLAGLIPDMSALPTWKHATPHTIQRQTEITKSCNNCHGADYTKFWFTDALGAAQGWVPDAYKADETSANERLKVLEPFPMAP